MFLGLGKMCLEDEPSKEFLIRLLDDWLACDSPKMKTDEMHLRVMRSLVSQGLFDSTYWPQSFFESLERKVTNTSIRDDEHI